MRVRLCIAIVSLACLATFPQRAAAEQFAYIYATNSNNGYALFGVDPVTGDRTIVSSIDRGTGPIGMLWGLTANNSGDIYVTDLGLDAILSIDPRTGNRRVVSSATVGTGPTFLAPSSITLDPDGNLIVLAGAFTNSGIWKIDPQTGNRTIISSQSLGIGSGSNFLDPRDVAVEPGGRIVVADRIGIMSVKPESGERRSISSSEPPVRGTGSHLLIPSAIAVAQGGSLVVADNGMHFLLSIDPVSGDRTVLRGTVQARDVAVDSHNNLLYVEGDTIYRYDPISRTREVVSSSSSTFALRRGEGPAFPNIRSIAYVVIPEPATNLLLAFGLLSICGPRLLKSRTRNAGGAHFAKLFSALHPLR